MAVTLSKPISIALAACVAAAGGWWIYQHSFARWEQAKAQRAAAAILPAAAAKAPYKVDIHAGPSTPVVMARNATIAGNPAAVACSTCHTTRTPDLTIKSGAALKEFHQGLTYKHGELSCLSCHNADNYDTLRRADGSSLTYENTMQLCAQCHGPHYRDYSHGSHGGMMGYWDLSRGPRERNTCTDCHDAHAPLYPRVRPVFPPRDRGARQQAERDTHAHHAPSHP